MVEGHLHPQLYSPGEILLNNCQRMETSVAVGCNNCCCCILYCPSDVRFTMLVALTRFLMSVIATPCLNKKNVPIIGRFLKFLLPAHFADNLQ